MRAQSSTMPRPRPYRADHRCVPGVTLKRALRCTRRPDPQATLTMPDASPWKITQPLAPKKVKASKDVQRNVQDRTTRKSSARYQTTRCYHFLLLPDISDNTTRLQLACSKGVSCHANRLCTFIRRIVNNPSQLDTHFIRDSLPDEGHFVAAWTQYRQLHPEEGYPDTRTRFIETYKLLREQFAGEPIVDIGGWPGDFAFCLAGLGLSVSLVDRGLERPMGRHQVAGSRAVAVSGDESLEDRCKRLGINAISCDIEREALPFDTGSVKTIIFTEVLEHLLGGTLHALREIRRVLAPTGIVILSTPNLLTLKNRFSLAFGRVAYDTLDTPYDALDMDRRMGHMGHFRVYSMPEVRDLVEKTGFRVTASSYQTILPESELALPLSPYSLRRLVGRLPAAMFPSLRNSIFLVLTGTRQPL